MSASKDDKQTYARFIGYYVKHLEPTVAASQWKKFFRLKLGASFDKASEASLKDVAYILYYAHFASMASCVQSWELIEKLKTPEKIKALLIAAENTRIEHGVHGVPVMFYTKDKDVREHMESFEGTVDAVKEIMSSPSKTKPKTAASKPKAKAAAKRSSKKTSAKTSGKCDDYNLTELRKMAAEQNIEGRSKMKKAELCDALNLGESGKSSSKPKPKVSPKAHAKRRTCSEYSLKELKELAAKRNVEGRSKMKKAELCKAMRIKVD